MKIEYRYGHSVIDTSRQCGRIVWVKPTLVQKIIMAGQRVALASGQAIITAALFGISCGSAVFTFWSLMHLMATP